MATAPVTKPKAKASKNKTQAEKWLASIQRAAILLKQVSDPTRIQVISMLADGERHVGSLSEDLGQPPPRPASSRRDHFSPTPREEQFLQPHRNR